MAETVDRLGSRGPARGRRAADEGAARLGQGAKAETDGMTEASREVVTLQDLREFLEADAEQVPADPHFKERLREKLWAMLQARRRRTRGED